MTLKGLVLQDFFLNQSIKEMLNNIKGIKEKANLNLCLECPICGPPMLINELKVKTNRVLSYSSMGV